MIKLAEDQTVNMVGRRHYGSTGSEDERETCVPSVFRFVPNAKNQAFQKELFPSFILLTAEEKLQQSPDPDWFQKAHQSVNTREQRNKSHPLI